MGRPAKNMLRVVVAAMSVCFALGVAGHGLGEAPDQQAAAMPAMVPNPLTGYLGVALEAQEHLEAQQEAEEAKEAKEAEEMGEGTRGPTQDAVAKAMSEEMAALLKVGQEREAKVAALTRENEVLKAEDIEEAAVVLEH